MKKNFKTISGIRTAIKYYFTNSVCNFYCQS